MTGVLAVEPRPVARACAAGAVLLVAASLLAEALERAVDDFDGTAWIWPPFALTLLAYTVAGFVAGRAADRTPLVHGAVAALGALAVWLAVRVAVPLVRADDLGFGGRQVLAGVALALGLGMLGAALARTRG